ncbi:MAG: hypothetical protein F6K25_05980 [Okeania sp. SIO2G4]|nr:MULTISPECIES: hypothetical protein [unclassified Okeania]NEP03770.1 hypothetical protein [Okeania sp. SIO4D6]NEP70547.1 hypothetical protein [Okeania sp. SIO2G5]NEP96268.1 hypothetical protein [Okeania sp. SIO2F5]NEQ90292.1 hypothetical protein [Okeania sp. SIO2G4]
MSAHKAIALFVIIDVLSIYWTIVICLHTKRSLCSSLLMFYRFIGQ